MRRSETSGGRGCRAGRGLTSAQLDLASRGGQASGVAFDAQILNDPIWLDEPVDGGRTVLVVSYDPPEDDRAANPGCILVEVCDDATTAKRKEFQAGCAVAADGSLVPPVVVVATSVRLISADRGVVIRLLRRLRPTRRWRASRTPGAAAGVPLIATGQGPTATGRSPAAADQESATAQFGRLDGCQVVVSGRIAVPPLREVGPEGDDLIPLLVAYDPPGSEDGPGFVQVEPGFIQVEASASRLDGEVPDLHTGDIIHFGGRIAFPPGVVKADFIRPVPIELEECRGN